MNFEEKIAALSRRVPELREHLTTEEATKNALVMPFLSCLGYDVFNPEEVVPEFVADVGTKKGEKVDYAIKRNGEIILLVECKKCGADLGHADMSQLYRYFSVTNARIAILTNGVEYFFFSDLEATNRMDSRPFLELNLGELRPSALAELKKLGREEFDLDRMLSAATDLKYTSEVKKVLIAQLENPDEEFVRFFYARANPGGRFTSAARETFTPIVSKACQQYVRELVSDRLRNALESEDVEAKPEPAEQAEQDTTTEDKDGVVTTEEELEGFRIVRAIACQAVRPERVVFRDSKTYMAVLLDDNNRKPICRLWFNTKQKYVGVFDEHKDEAKIPIESISDIYLLSSKFIEAIQRYESAGE